MIIDVVYDGTISWMRRLRKTFNLESDTEIFLKTNSTNLLSKSTGLHSLTIQEILLHKVCSFRVYTWDGHVIH